MEATRPVEPDQTQRVVLAAAIVRAGVLDAQHAGLPGTSAMPAHTQLQRAAWSGEGSMVFVEAILQRYPLTSSAQQLYDSVLTGTWDDIDTFIGSRVWNRAASALQLLSVADLPVARDWFWNATMGNVVGALQMWSLANTTVTIGVSGALAKLIITLLTEHPKMTVSEAWAVAHGALG